MFFFLVLLKIKLGFGGKWIVQHTLILLLRSKKNKLLLTQSCNEDSSMILGEGCLYWVHDFVATFGVNARPIYMVAKGRVKKKLMDH